MPLTIPDQTIPSQVNVPDAMTTLNSIMNFKSNKLKYQADSANFAEKTALRDLVNSPGVQNPDGSVNPDKYAAAAIKVAPTLGATTAQGGLGNQTTSIGNRAMNYKLTSEQGQKVQDMGTGLMNNKYVIGAADAEKMKDPEYASEMQHGILQSLSDTEDQMEANGLPKLMIKAKMAPLYLMAQKDPSSMRGYFGNVMTQGLSAQGQAGVVQPTMVNNGQQAVNVNPLAAQPPIQQQLAPNTPVMQGTTQGYLGPQPTAEDATLDNQSRQGPQGLDLSNLSPVEQQFLMRKNPQAFSNGAMDFQQTAGAQSQPVQGQPQKPGFVASGLPIGAEQGILGPVAANNEHYKQVASEAQQAPTRIAALSTIKQEAPIAMTGGGDYRRTVLRQLSGAFGVAEEKQTSNDVMAKNLAMMASQAGNTDAARALGEIANPNAHMTQEAIEKTVDQLIGIEKKKMAAQSLFGGMMTNDPAYAQKTAVWNKNADPRLFEYASLPDSQKKEWMSKLSADDRANLARKAEALHNLGVSP